MLWNKHTFCINDPLCREPRVSRFEFGVIKIKWTGPTCALCFADLQQMVILEPVLILTHWGRDKMAAIFQTTVSNGFSWMKMFEFWLTFHWSLFLGVLLTIFQHWYIPYMSSVIGRIYNGIVIQYWRSCTPSRSIGECTVPGLNGILCFPWFTNCVLLFDKNLILGCLWHLVFV